jgi:hypothetical protein
VCSPVPLEHCSPPLWRFSRPTELELFVALAMWVCLGQDYLQTREIYFTGAMLHVLAETPFLLRTLWRAKTKSG